MTFHGDIMQLLTVEEDCGDILIDGRSFTPAAVDVLVLRLTHAAVKARRYRDGVRKLIARRARTVALAGHTEE